MGDATQSPLPSLPLPAPAEAAAAIVNSSLVQPTQMQQQPPPPPPPPQQQQQPPHGSSSLDTGALVAALDAALAAVPLEMASVGVAVDALRDRCEALAGSSAHSQMGADTIASAAVPSLTMLLRSHAPPSLRAGSTEVTIRARALDVLSRVSWGEPLRVHASPVAAALLTVLQHDYEDNGVAAHKVLMSVHRSYRGALEAEALAYVDFVTSCFTSLPRVVTELLNDGIDAVALGAAMGVSSHGRPLAAIATDALAAVRSGSLPRMSVPAAGEQPLLLRPLVARESFRVLAEMPMSVVILYQYYTATETSMGAGSGVVAVIAAIMPVLRVASLCDVASLAAGDMPSRGSSLSAAEATARAQVATSGAAVEAAVSVARLRAARNGEFVSAVSKALIFCAYILRLYGARHSVTEPHAAGVAASIARLLACAGGESLGLRREVIQALRSLAALSEMRPLLLPDVPLLLDERLLLGIPGAAALDSLRATAVTAVADLLHNLRDEMPFDTLARSQAFFSRVIVDSTLPLATHTVALRLLSSYVSNIFGSTGTPAAAVRALLVDLLAILVAKLDSLRRAAPLIVAAERRAAEDALRERRLHAARARRVAAASELAATALREGGGATTVLVNGVETSVAAAAVALHDGLQRAFVSPWVADEYAEWAAEQSRPGDTAREARGCLKTLVLAFRSVLWSITNFKKVETEAAAKASAESGDASLPPTTGASGDAAGASGGPNGLGPASHGASLSADELRLVSRYLSSGLATIYVLYARAAAAPFGESVEIQEHYANAFTALDLHQFRDVFSGGLPTLLERLFMAPQLLMAVPQYLLAEGATCRPFGELMLASLTRHVHLLNTDDDDDTEEWRAPAPAVPPAPRAEVEGQRQRRRAVGGAPVAPLARAIATGGVGDCGRANATVASASAPWVMNEDGEFDDLLAGSVAGAVPPPAPDAELLAQQARLGAAADAEACASAPPLSPVSPAALPHAAAPAPRFSVSDRAITFLRLFKMVIYGLASPSAAASATSVTAGSAGSALGEPILTLQPFCAPLVRSALRNAAACRHPVQHLYLLRTLFRVVTAASTRPDPREQFTSALYAEFGPLVPLILDSLMRLYAGSSDAPLRDSVLELCMTVPLRLSMQLPHLAPMFRPVILCLRSRDDRKNLAGMGLRTLEFWMDNLTPTFFAAALSAPSSGFGAATIGGELMAALAGLLRPPPAPLGLDALRLFGKLGGLNREWIALPPRIPLLAVQGGGSSSGAGAGGLPASGLTVRLRWRAGSAGRYTPPADIHDHDLPAMEAAAAGVPAAASSDAGGCAVLDLPLDRIIHYAHRILVRYHSVPSTAAVAAPTPPSQRLVRRRVAPGASVHRLRDDGHGVPTASRSRGVGAREDARDDEYARPIRRTRRSSTTGELIAISPQGAPRATYARIAAARADAVAARGSGDAPTGTSASPLIAYGSDSDSGGEDDDDAFVTEVPQTVGPDAYASAALRQTHPAEALRLATRGMLVAKRHAWELLVACVPALLSAIPALTRVHAATASDHLYTAADESGCRRVATTSAAARPTPPRLRAVGDSTSDSGAGVAAGDGGAAAVRGAAATIAAARRVQIELLRALAVAASDMHLRSLAMPVLLGLARQYVLLAVRLAPQPLAEGLPFAITAPHACGIGDSRPPLQTHVGELAAAAAVDGATVLAVLTRGGGVGALPGVADPLLLNTAIISIACDEPFNSSAPCAARPVVLALLEEVHGVLCATAAVTASRGRNVVGPPLGDPMREQLAVQRVDVDNASSDDDDDDDDTYDDDDGYGVVGRATSESDTPARCNNTSSAGETYAPYMNATRSRRRRLHAVAVTGRLLLADLSARLALACQRPTGTAKAGASHVITALVARLHPAWAQYHGPELLKCLFAVLRHHPPEGAAITVAAAFGALRGVVRAVLPPVSELRRLASAAAAGGDSDSSSIDDDLRSLDRQGLPTRDVERLAACLTSPAEGLCSYRGPAREAAAYVLGQFVRRLYARQQCQHVMLHGVPDAEAPLLTRRALARGMLTLVAPHTRSLHARLVRSPQRQMRPADQIGQLFALSCILHLISEAAPDVPEKAPTAPPAAPPAPDAAAAGAAGALPPPSHQPPAWRRVAAVFVAQPTDFHSPIVAKLHDALKLTRLHDQTVAHCSPAAIAAGASAAATATARAGPGERLGGRETASVVSAVGGQSVGPITVGAAVAASGTTSLHTISISSAANPPIEATPTAQDAYVLLAAAQSFPYPMAAPIAPPAATRVNESEYNAFHGLLDSPASVVDPRLSDQIGDGRIHCHVVMSPRSWAAPVGLSAGRSDNVAASVRVVRPLSYEPTSEYQPLQFHVLLRAATLRLTEALYCAAPHLLLAPGALGNAATRKVRDEAFKLLFECAPNPAATTTATAAGPPGVPDYVTAGLITADRVPLPHPPAYGHLRLILRAMHGALAATQAAHEAARATAAASQVLPDGVDAAVVGANATPPADGVPSEGGELDANERGLPRELLHAALRPVLLNLSNYKNTSPDVVEVLGTLLTRIAYCFNVSLAYKLVRDLSAWQFTDRIRGELGNTSREPEAAAAIMNLFHLLPLEARDFVPSFAVTAAVLERKLHLFRARDVLTSPFRRPMARFLSRYPAAGVAYFLSERRALNPALAELFIGALRVGQPDASGLLAYLASPEGLSRIHAALLPDVVRPAALQAPDTAEGFAAAPISSYSSAEIAALHLVAVRVMRALASHADKDVGDGGADTTPSSSFFVAAPGAVALLRGVWRSDVMRARAGLAPITRNASPSLSGVQQALPQALRATHYADVRGALHLMMGCVRHYISRARAAAVAAAAAGTTHGVAPPVPDALPLADTVSLISCLVEAFVPNGPIDLEPVRALLTDELASCPSSALRKALLAHFLRIPSTIATSSAPRNGDASTLVGADGDVSDGVPLSTTALAAAFRYLVLPLLRSTFAAEAHVAAVMAAESDDDDTSGVRAYIEAGGVYPWSRDDGSSAPAAMPASAAVAGAEPGAEPNAMTLPVAQNAGTAGVAVAGSVAHGAGTSKRERSASMGEGVAADATVPMAVGDDVAPGSPAAPGGGAKRARLGAIGAGAGNEAPRNTVTFAAQDDSSSTGDVGRTGPPRAPPQPSVVPPLLTHGGTASTPSTRASRWAHAASGSHLRTPSHRGGRSSSFVWSPGAGTPLASFTLGSGRSAPFTPFSLVATPSSLGNRRRRGGPGSGGSATTSVPPMRRSWADAVYAATAARAPDGPVPPPATASRSTTFSPAYPFPRLVGTAFIEDVLAWIGHASAAVKNALATNTAASAPLAASQVQPLGEAEPVAIAGDTVTGTNSNASLPPPAPTAPALLPDDLTIELLRVADVLLSAMGRELAAHARREVIKFVWQLLLRQEWAGPVQGWAYMVTCRYVQVFESTPRVSLQMLTALLKLRESRDLARRALNVLVPSLQLRTSEGDFIKFMKSARKTVIDEASGSTGATPTAACISHAWGVVVDHARVFYPIRASLLPAMVSAISKLVVANMPSSSASSSSSTTSSSAASSSWWHRSLAVDMLGVIASWQAQTRLELLLSQQRTASAAGVLSDERLPVPAMQPSAVSGHLQGVALYPTPASGYPVVPFTGDASPLPSPFSDAVLVELTIGFTARSAVLNAETTEVRHLARRCADMFYAFLRVWPDVPPRTQHLARMPLVGAGAPAAARGAALQPAEREAASLGQAMLLELLLGITAAEGRARDFLTDNAGFVMCNLVPTFASSDRRVQALLRRLLRRLLTMYPIASPTNRMQHVRLYPWALSCISLRLSSYLGLPFEKQTEIAKTTAEQNDPLPEVRSRSREENNLVRAIADGSIRPPMPPPRPGDQPFVPSTAPDAVAAKVTRAGELAAMSTRAAELFSDFTLERAKRHVENAKEDDRLAREAWSLVKDLGGGGGGSGSGTAEPRFGPVTDANLVGILRELRDIAKYAPAVLRSLEGVLVLTLTALSDRHMSSAPVAANGTGGGDMSRLDTLAPDIAASVVESRAARATAVCLLLALNTTRSTLLRAHRTKVVTTVTRLLLRSADPMVVRTALQIVSIWMTSEPVATGGPREGVNALPFGLTHREKMGVVVNLLSLTLNPAGGLLTDRHLALGDAFSSLQNDFYRVMMRIFVGRNGDDAVDGSTDGRDTDYSVELRAAYGHALGVASSKRHPAPAWLQGQLRRQLLTSAICSDEVVRNRGFALLVGDARASRVRALRDEVDRQRAAVVAATARFRTTRARRRRGDLPSHLAPGVAWQVSDALVRGLPGEATLDAIGDETAYAASALTVPSSSGGGSGAGLDAPRASDPDGGLRFMIAIGDEREQELLHGSVDAATAAAFSAAYVGASGASTGDERPRLAAFAGVEATGTSLSSSNALTAVQDVLSADSDVVSGFFFLPIATRMLLLGLNNDDHGEISAIETQESDLVGLAENNGSRGSADAHAVALGAASASFLSGGVPAFFAARTPLARHATVSSRLLHALGDACATSLDIACDIWLEVFPSAWGALSATERERLTPHAASMLIKDTLQLQLVSGNAVAHLEAALGSGPLRDRERERGYTSAAIASEHAWGAGPTGSVGALEAAVGSGSVLLPIPDVSPLGSVSGAVAAIDPWSSNIVPLLLAGFARASPPLVLPPEVLAYVGRNTGAQDAALPVLEVQLEDALVEVTAARVALTAAVHASASAAARRISGDNSSDHTGAADLRSDRLAVANLLAPRVLLSDYAGDCGARDDAHYNALRRGDTAVRARPGGILATSDLQHVVAMRERLSAAKASASSLVATLLGLYSSLSLDDLARGTRRRFAASLTAARGLDLEAHGMWPEAQEAYAGGIAGAHASAESVERSAAVGTLNPISTQVSASHVAQIDSQTLRTAAAALVPPRAAPAAAANEGGTTTAVALPETAQASGAARIKNDTQQAVAPSGVTPAVAAAVAITPPSTVTARCTLDVVDPAMGMNATAASRVARFLRHATCAGEHRSTQTRKPMRDMAGSAMSLIAEEVIRGGASAIVSRVKRHRIGNADVGSKYLLSLMQNVLATSSSRDTGRSVSSGSGMGAMFRRAAGAALPPGAGSGGSVYVKGFQVARREPEPTAALAAAVLADVPAAVEPLALKPVIAARQLTVAAQIPTEAGAGSMDGTAAAQQPSVPPVLAVEQVQLWLPGAGDVELFGERWIEAGRALCQWNVLAEMAWREDDDALMAEAASRLGNWSELARVVRRPTVALEATRHAGAKVFELQLAIMEGRTTDVAQLTDTANTFVLRAWNSLPPYPGAAHEALLATCSRLAELRESAAVVDAVRSFATRRAATASSSAPTPPDTFDAVRALVLGWRERLPNPHESISSWDALLTWRRHVFAHVQALLAPVLDDGAKGTEQLASLRDSAWNVVALARAARRHGLRDVSAGVLHQLGAEQTTGVSKPFSTTREAVLVALPDGHSLAVCDWQVKRLLQREDMRLVAAGCAPVVGEAAAAAARAAAPSASFSRADKLHHGYLSPEALAAARGGLSTLLATSVDTFDDAQRGELLRIGGAFRTVLGEEHWPAAHVAFGAGALAARTSGRCWLSWGAYLEAVFTRARIEVALARESSAVPTSTGAMDDASTVPPVSLNVDGSHLQAAVAAIVASASAGVGVDAAAPVPTSTSTDTAAAGATDSAATPSHVAAPALAPTISAADALIEVARQAVVALLTGVSLRCATPVLQIARVLALLAATDGAPQLVEALRLHSSAMPAWVWVPWIPSLLSGLSRRSERDACKRLLLALSTAYPQATFFQLRAFGAERKEAAAAAVGGGGGGASAPSTPVAAAIDPGAVPPASVVASVDEILGAMMRSHAASWELDVFMRELHERCRLPAEADAFGLLVTMLAQAEKLAGRAATARLHGALSAAVSNPNANASTAPQQQQPQPARSVDDSSEARARNKAAADVRDAEQIASLNVHILSTLGKMFQGAPPLLGPHVAVLGAVAPATSTQGPSTAARAARFAARFRAALYTDLAVALPPAVLDVLRADEVSVSTDNSAGATGANTSELMSPGAVASAAASRKRPRQDDGADSQPAQPSSLSSSSSSTTSSSSSTLPVAGTDTPVTQPTATIPSAQPDAFVPNPAGPRSLAALCTRLRYWRGALLAYFALRPLHVPSGETGAISLVDTTPALTEALGVGGDVEVPGQYSAVAADVEPVPSTHVRVIGVDPRCGLHFSPLAGAVQRIALLGDDGRRHCFTFTSGYPQTCRTLLRVAQLTSFLNALLARFPDARSRRLAFSTAAVVPLTHKLKLVADAPGAASLGTFVDEHLAALGRAAAVNRAGNGDGADSPLVAYYGDLVETHRSVLIAAADDGSAVRVATETGNAALGYTAALFRAYRAAAARLPATALTSALSASVASPDGFAAMRARMSYQLALASLLTFLLHTGDRHPGRVMLSPAAGAVYASDVRPGYNTAGGALDERESPETVPFRLTRNLATLLGPNSIVGPFASTIVAADRAAFAHLDLLWDIMSVFYRDDSAEWAGPPALALPAAASNTTQELGIDLSFAAVASQRRTALNVSSFFSRVVDLQAPSLPSKVVSANPIGPAAPADLLNSKVFWCIENAMAERNLVRMPVSWHPWV